MQGQERVAIHVTGRVQGVFYRATAQKKAQELNLTGWVANEPDGSVTIVAEGAHEALQRFVRWAQKGSSSANVEDMTTEWGSATDEFNTFTVRHR